jgi:ArsR family transcriptional regulator, arsenate/arsenite/antimonite-responsive transcriptional repressor
MPSIQDQGADLVFKALAAGSRRHILAILAAGPQGSSCCSTDEFCGCDLTTATGLGAPTVSHHMSVLVEAGLVSAEKRGTWVFYRVNPTALTRAVEELRALIPGDSAATAPTPATAG